MLTNCGKNGSAKKKVGIMAEQLNQQKRFLIFFGRQNGWSYTRIANEVGCSKSTISDEFKRNSVDGRHDPYFAQNLAEQRLHSKNLFRTKCTRAMFDLALDNLYKGTSFEATSQRSL